MCLSCGCGKADEDHGDSRNITMNDLKRAAEAAGTTPDKVAQNIMSGSGYQQGSTENSSTAQFPQSNANSSGSFLPADQPERHPGQYAQQLGQESGSDWQESQQMRTREKLSSPASLNEQGAIRHSALADLLAHHKLL